jgi:2-oxoglutarate ferredoxin oxidoreductase subunit gamma
MVSSGIRIAGFGGQGVILAGMVIGKAAAIHDGKFATLTQSFGPEARGSACSAQLIVSDEPILYPYLTQPDILVVMSQEASARFGSDLKPGGLLLYEQDLIHLQKLNDDIRSYGIPATRFAEELGRKLVLNLVMVGFVTALTGLATPQAVREAIADSVPKGTENLNLAAFEKGLAFGQGLLSAPRAA